MQPFSLLLALFLLLLANLVPQAGTHQKPSGIPDADQQINQPVEPSFKAPNKRLDKDAVKQEAEQLKKLADAVPADIGQVTNGKLPKDLVENLKHIEGLAKHLRNEVSP